jgi:flagellar P-ring protein precursor FlgI
MNLHLNNRFKIRTRLAAALLLLAVSVAPAFGALVRIKDVSTIAGVRDIQLFGLGLVTGLAWDGDKNPVYTVQAVANMLLRAGINVPAATILSKNVAAVTVTANIPAFVKPGTRLDVTVASLGDARSLQGGVLMQCPLAGADGNVYAVAQGPLSIGGFVGGVGGPGGATTQKNHPTVGQMVGGALVEREIPTEILHGGFIEWLVREPDFTTTVRMAQAINEVFTNSALAIDSTTVRVAVPPGVQSIPIDFIARVEAVRFVPDTPARIIITERTGTIVANAHIQVSRCAISHGNLTINISSSLNVSQPNALAGGATAVTPQTRTEVIEGTGRLIPITQSPTVEDVAQSLNMLGVTPRDMISIFQAMKQAGALHAELLIK